jgi:hypothetical protein
LKGNGEELEEGLSAPLARVKDQYLYTKDIEGIVPEGVSREDSISFVDRHINNWVKKQLLIAEARQHLEFDEVEMERKVLDYRYALMMHEFEKIYVNSKLNSEITDQEIKQYYNFNLENFKLEQNIIRGIFVQLPRDAPKITRFRYLLRSNGVEEYEELKSYCYRFATKAHLEDSTWLFFSDISSNIPLQNVRDETQFLKNNKNYETSDENFYYFLKISDYKIQKETSPLEFVEDEIRKVILHKRKVAIAKELEDNIYDKAVKNEDFEVY